MPLFVDVHKHADCLSEAAIAEAHLADLETQAKYGVKYLHYWFDQSNSKFHCLVDAPSKEAAIAVHREAHGLMADDIVEVLHRPRV